MRFPDPAPGAASWPSVTVRAVAAMAVVVLVAACGAVVGSGKSAVPSPTSSDGTPAQPGTTYHDPSARATQRFADGVIAFDFPASWSSRKGTVNPSGNRTVVFVGPEELPSDCVETAQGGTCGPWPAMKMAANGIVVAWRAYGMPHSTPPEGGDPTDVGGRPATMTRGRPTEGCAAIGGDESIGVVVTPGAGQLGWIGIDACLSGPDHEAAEAGFASILASATVQ